MSLVIFSFGMLVFLITVYGTVVAGVLQLTVRQLRDDPSLSRRAGVNADDLDSTSAELVQSEF